MKLLLNEITSSKRSGHRKIDLSSSGWEETGIEKALENKNILMRYNSTLEFVSQSVNLSVLKNSRILDAGEYNPFSKWLKDEHGITVENTPPEFDFDYSYQSEHGYGKFDFVFAFEIIEHLMNPLAFLEFLKNSLEDDGKLFISTPFARPRFLWSRFHLTEYYPDKIELMANKAGFEVRRLRIRKVFPCRYALRGIRPLLRALWFNRIMFFEFRLEPAD